MSESTPTTPSNPEPTPPDHAHRAHTALTAHGEPQLWLCGGALLVALLMVVGVIGFIFRQGMKTFFPQPLVQVKTLDGKKYLGEVTATETFRLDDATIAALPPQVRAAVDAEKQAGRKPTRRAIRTGNYELTKAHGVQVANYMIAEESQPEWAVAIERVGGKVTIENPRQRANLERLLSVQKQIVVDRILSSPAGRCNGFLVAWLDGESVIENDPSAILAKWEQIAGTALDQRGTQLFVVEAVSGERLAVPASAIERMYTPNRLSSGESWGIWASRWGSFLTEKQRGDGTEGGIWPAILGTVLLTLTMTVVVVPFGVLAALYLREYAKQGIIVSLVRIAVNNLAGVPSIVFGAFGLGFFCITVGGGVDAVLYPEQFAAKNPVFGGGTILWASLTLALLTLPVVIVATEEALSAVPRSLREASYGCGASKWQTLRRVVIPAALPGIMTGAILAMARGAGEVAPIMLTGVEHTAVIPIEIDGSAPFVHPHMSRKFNHLGYHMYQVAFHSPDSEGARRMFYTTATVLVSLVVLLNITAIALRAHLRRKYKSGQF